MALRSYVRLVILSVSRVTELSVSVSGTDMSQLNLVIQLHCCLGILTSSFELSPVKISAVVTLSFPRTQPQSSDWWHKTLSLCFSSHKTLSLCFSSRSTLCYNYIAAFLFLTK